MKKQVAAFIRNLGGKAHYSGNDKTMYVTASNVTTLKFQIRAQFGALEFEIKKA